MIEINNSKIVENQELDLDYTLDFYQMLLDKVENRGSISLMDNERLKELNLLVNNLNENNLSEENVSIQEIKKLREKIISHFQNLREYEYVYDYFVSHEEDDYEEENEADHYKENDESNEGFYKLLSSLKSLNYAKDKSTLCDLLPLTSKEFLQNKLKMNEEQITQLKGKEDNKKSDSKLLSPEIESKINKSADISDEIETFPNKNSYISPLIKINQNKDRSKLNELLLSKEYGNTNLKSQSAEKIEKEMDEEINKEIFNYTKNMKQYAKNFNELLNTDNKKLDKIEKNQEKGKIKTDNSLKSLKEFNYSLTIGFWKTLLMFLFVGITFVMTLLAIRIFPKLVK